MRTPNRVWFDNIRDHEVKRRPDVILCLKNTVFKLMLENILC